MNEQALTLEEIHKQSVEILKKIISICDELDVNYFLAYGSLIGAVRHKGFIPWDDDLDLIMLRPDYEKFKAYCSSNEKALYPFKLMGRHNTPGFPYTIDRFCDLRYRMESDSAADAGMGMFIDIYPFDGAGNDEQEAMEKIGRKKWFLINSLRSGWKDKFEPSTHGILRTVVKFIGYVFARAVGPDYFLDRLEGLKNTFTLEDSKYVVCMIWDWPIKVKEKKHFQEFTYLPFEGVKVKVPKEYDAVLRNSYGDYMQLPPEESRVPHHEYKLYRKPEFFTENGKEDML